MPDARLHLIDTAAAAPTADDARPSRQEAEAAIRTLIRYTGDSPAREGLLDGKLKFRPLMIPDAFTEQASQADMYAAAGLDRAGIVATVLDTLGRAEPLLVTSGDKLA